MTGPGLDHVPDLAPGEACGVELQNGGQEGMVCTIVPSMSRPLPPAQCYIWADMLNFHSTEEMTMLSIETAGRSDMALGRGGILSPGGGFDSQQWSQWSQ